MAALFGDDVRYTPQGGGDLGERMHRAIGCALDEGAPCALVVGTDVPALDARMLRAALGRLRTHDVVLGPTTDGGYYLVGLKAPAPGTCSGGSTGARPPSSRPPSAPRHARACRSHVSARWPMSTSPMMSRRSLFGSCES